MLCRDRKVIAGKLDATCDSSDSYSVVRPSRNTPTFRLVQSYEAPPAKAQDCPKIALK